MRKEEGAREEDRQTEMRPPLRLLSMLSAHSSSFKPSLAVSIAERDSVSSSYPMQSVRITCCGAVSDAFMEALMCFGAGSCSIEDAHLGAPQEQEVFLTLTNFLVVLELRIFSDGPVPWTGDTRQLWNESRITALFPAGEDVAKALAMAADSVGLTEMPQYEVVNTEKIDWV
ncbi:unnamed protein product [Sphagnum troendelagicum]|uniref:Uncharacterized protein n=1 Tax=Sphagnum troendelagicum TaxID=128251 RepID=A0ABP0V3L6_9BRYO